MKCLAGQSTSWNQDFWEKYINNLRYTDDTTLMVESEEELRASWWTWGWKWKKISLELNIQKSKIIASGQITSWQIDGGKKKWKQWQTLFS